MSYQSSTSEAYFETDKPDESDFIVEEEKVPMEDSSPKHGQEHTHKQQVQPQIPSFGDVSTTPEQKIQNALDFMEKTLAQAGSPHFKEFWEARKQCLELFKENVSPQIRGHLWAKYCDLSKEARRLKEILDEQAAFAVEQIDIAIKALEDEITHEQDALSKAPLVHFEPFPVCLDEKIDGYINSQRLLGLLNAHASRINVLRKELISTEMRIRLKNKFFQRLSQAGDKVFPTRKELIKEISSDFMEDVDAFIAKYFSVNALQGDIYPIREEIKALQSMAKQLTLNTHAFTHTRRSLSSCWDKIKDIEKERKKVRSHQKAQFKEQQDAIEAEIKALLEAFMAESTTLEDARQQYGNLNNKIRNTELGRDEVRYLRDALSSLREQIDSKEKAIQQAIAHEEQQKAAQRMKKVNSLKEKLQEILLSSEDKSIDELSGLLIQLSEEAETLHLNRNERSLFDRSCRELKERISKKKDEEIFALAENGEGSADITAIKADLKTLNKHRTQIKETLDNLKKQSGSSGFDISKAMELTQQIHVEKERYDKATAAINDLESKLRSFRR